MSMAIVARRPGRAGRLVRLTCVLLGLALGLAGGVSAQDDTTFVATVDRTTITADDVLTLRLTLSGTFRHADQPQLPAFPGFSVLDTSQSSQFSMINGRTSSSIAYIYRLAPTEIGTLTIPAISLDVGGQRLSTQPIDIEVRQGSMGAPGATPVAPSEALPQEAEGRSLYVEAEVDEPSPIVGQQVVYTFRLYQAIQLYAQPQLTWPEFAGFMSYALSPNRVYNQVVAGRQYRVTEVRKALFPTSAGDRVIGPAIFTLPGDFFNRGVRLETESVTLGVRPVPDGAPVSFAGAVGQFELQATVDPGQVLVNEPVTLRVTVSGDGNLAVIGDPSEEALDALAGWRVYDAQVSTETTQDADRIRGSKTFERLLVPKVAGEQSIPALHFVYWDPAAQEYVELASEPLPVTVSPGAPAEPQSVILGDQKQDVAVFGSDIRHIRPAPPSLALTKLRGADAGLLAIGAIAPLSLVASAWLARRRRNALRHDPAAQRSARALRQARRSLAAAQHVAVQDPDAADAAVGATLRRYIADKLDLATPGLTLDLIEAQLLGRGVADELVARVRASLQAADSGRYAPRGTGTQAASSMSAARTLLADIEEALS